MIGVQMLSVEDGDDDIRLDRWFKKKFPGIRHSQLEKLLRTGQIRLDGARAKAGTRVRVGQSVRVPPIPSGTLAARTDGKSTSGVSTMDAKDLRAAILYRDNDVIALNKAAGLAVQGGSGVRRHLDAMLDALTFDAAERPRLVHRLDKDTSGVMLVGRSGKSARSITEAFRSNSIKKIYWAIVCGVPRPREGEINGFLIKQRVRGNERIVVGPEGQSASTHYRTIALAAQRAAWVEIRPQTGRTHQLRVHCASIGTPILGDGKYGGRRAFLDNVSIAKRLHLHARAITFPHPRGGTRTVVAPLPPHMKGTWSFFGFHENDPAANFTELDQIR